MTQPDSARAPRVVAAVVTYNRIDLLRQVVERIRAVPGVAEVLVVDNASADGTGAWLASLADTADSEGAPVLGRTLDENRGERAGSTRACGGRSSVAPTSCG